ncbi:DUF4365 domain-containing protein [Bradyrhizobium diazoefficiens]|uniref:DUF4365 domain-containing protein n=1 Tax=Bradyrhizobium diazoefficiens TaxID=1355477 RepID=UPI0015B39E27|nr:DUF4365 domain-containing protein [Bradyrhizobium diazoefficiens]QLD45610.1 DUF4365 domain-containing protein [Bradyrhizobium diazoefficiens]
MMKLSSNQLIGERGELLAGERAMSMGFAFDQKGRLETGVDGMLELRDPRTGRMLAKWVGAQIKTTESDRYSYEDDNGFQYLLDPDHLVYWRDSNLPLIIVLVRLSTSEMYWKQVDAGAASEPRRLHFDKTADRFDRKAADRIAALCIERDKLGTYVPPMLSGEGVHVNMLSVVLPEKIFVATSLFASGRDAIGELEGDAPFDWVIRNRRFISFRDPDETSLMSVLDEGTVETVETTAISASDDFDDENAFIELLARTLRVQFDDKLSFDKESRSLYFRAKAMNKGWRYPYRSLINETSALVVSPWVRKKDGKIGNVRHHAFVPRFHRIGDDWFMTVTPTFVFTRDGYRPHHFASDLLSGKKKLEKNAAVRGQFLMWRYLLTAKDDAQADLLTAPVERGPLGFEAIEPIQMPVAVPEDAWKKEDPNAKSMEDDEWLL